MDSSPLREAGLTQGEVKVYCALLEIGPATTGPIVDASGVARSIIYQILEKLIDKGLVSYTVKEKTKYFQAAPPSRCLDFIDQRKQDLEANRKKVEAMLPSLLSLQSKAKGSQVRVFEGFNGMITVHENTYQVLKEGDEYFYMGIEPEMPGHVHAYFLKDHRRREKAGIKAKLLFHPSTPSSVLKERNVYRLCDARYMPIDIKTPAWFLGYKDFAVIGLLSSTPVIIEIRQPEIAASIRAYFDEFWKKSVSLKIKH